MSPMFNVFVQLYSIWQDFNWQCGALPLR